jgi:hypothetical protein
MDKIRAKPLKRLERVKRSDSNLPTDFLPLYQKLTETRNFCVGRFVRRFIGRVLSARTRALKRLLPTRQLRSFCSPTADELRKACKGSSEMNSSGFGARLVRG